jgi:para-aminobenzoate synthetase component I
VIEEPTVFYNKMLHWLNQCSIFCLLHNNDYDHKNNEAEIIVAAEAIQTFNFDKNCLQGIEELSKVKDWLFGHISYDVKNEIEHLTSKHTDPIGLEKVQFFVPQIILTIQKNNVEISSSEIAPSIIFNAILNQTETIAEKAFHQKLQPRISKEKYIETINALKNHIQKGDCYEINFCQEFFAENALINPLQLFKKLNAISPNPFAALYKQNDKYVICASPERYISKTGNLIQSQPIKGTIKRDLNNAKNDIELGVCLQENKKEQSENVMVVDLVRNDLSKVCKPNSVKVTELFGIYTFPQVHHLVSTITGELLPNIKFVDIIKATFPMGSMTGAPKVKVMQLIEEYEATNRGIFSGTIGYIKPNGDLDFNVVIRSIMYNKSTKYLCYQVGSGITIYCDAEKEYEECLLKAKAIEEVLN